MYVSQRLDYQYIAKHCSSVYLGFTKQMYEIRCTMYEPQLIDIQCFN
jgi:hypothetical protein